MEFLHLLLRHCFVRAQVVTSQNIGCFLRLKRKGFGGVLLSNFSLARILTHPKLWRYFEGNMPN